MKILLVFALFLVPIIFFSCGKNDTSTATIPTPTTPITPIGSWIVGANTYNSVYCARDTSNNALFSEANNKPGDLFTFILFVNFKKLPTVSGTYTIKSADSLKLGLGTSEITIFAQSADRHFIEHEDFLPIGKENSAAKATVTITSGKIKVDIPVIRVASYKSYSSIIDTVSLSGTLIED